MVKAGVKMTDPTALVTIRQFGDISDALLAKGCLDAAGIESLLTDVNIARLEWALSRGMRLQVEAKDAAAAIEALDGERA
jgi:hypothetical protein